MPQNYSCDHEACFNKMQIFIKREWDAIILWDYIANLPAHDNNNDRWRWFNFLIDLQRLLSERFSLTTFISESQITSILHTIKKFYGQRNIKEDFNNIVNFNNICRGAFKVLTWIADALKTFSWGDSTW